MEEHLRNLRDASILLVGSGGIGCEVVKNLMLNGARKLTIVDLDTIDVSNLNRQFLFLPEHVNRYKAEVARARALELNPEADVRALVCDVNSWRPEDVRGYDAVLNALDNVKARAHVNYCCVQSGVPLVESGSTGYNGQVYPILKDATKCFECDPLPRTTAIPVCSIRQIPEKPTHCIAWARMLYQLLFGTPDSANLLTDLSVPAPPETTRLEEQGVVEYLNLLFKFLFNSEVQSLLKMEKVWANRDPPRPLAHEFTLGELRRSAKRSRTDSPDPPGETGDDSERATASDEAGPKGSSGRATKLRKTAEGSGKKPADPGPAARRDKFSVLGLPELLAQFAGSVRATLLENPQLLGSAEFSKDDPTCMDFVASAANLRMLNFGIAPLSTWEAQSIAGSIVPAIAATNAIVAAFQVVQLMHLLSHLRAPAGPLSASKCRKVWIKSNVMGSNPLVKGRLAQPEPLDPPNPSCTTCQQRSLRVRVRSLEAPISELVQSVLVGALGLEVVNVDFDLRNVFDGEEFEEDPEYAASVRRNPLYFYGMADGSILTVTDLNGDAQFELVLQLEHELDCDFQLV